MHTIHWRMRIARRLGAIAVALVSSGCGVSGVPSDELGPEPMVSTEWAYELFMPNLYRVDNIVIDAQGEIFASIESESQGRVVRLDGGKQLTVIDELQRPDGLAIRFPYLYITEEVDEGRVIRLDLTDLSKTVLANLGGPEGIDFLLDGSLVVAEDHGGRIVRVTQDGEIEVLIEGLHKPEGLAVAPDGTVFFAETTTGRIMAITDNGLDTVVEGLNQPDQVEIASDGALWISEDAKPGRLLRYVSGRLEVIMAGLMAPQGIAFGRNGEIYVAEQKRNRILVLRRNASE